MPEPSKDPVEGLNQESAIVHLRREITQAGIDLFAAYGIALTPIASAADEVVKASEVSFLGVFGFGGLRFSGHVVLGAKESTLRRSNTTTSSSGDWMAELSNQFLGRIKNQLLRKGISIGRVPPAVVQGLAASLVCPTGGGLTVTLADDGDCRVLLWIKIESTPEGADAPRTTETDVLAEGEMVLF